MKLIPTYHVSPRGTYICIVGPGRILWYDGRAVEVSQKLPIAFADWREASPSEQAKIEGVFAPHI